MRRLTITLACAACASKPPAPPPAPPAPPPPPPHVATADEQVAIGFVTHLLGGEWDAAHGFYDPSILDKVKLEELQAIGAQLLPTPAKPSSATATTYPNDPTWVRVDATMADGTLFEESIHVVHGHVFGLVVKPGYQTPPYVRAAAYDDREIAVGAGGRALPGILSVPKGKGPFPVVILLQGSGGSDLDEWTGGPAVMNVMLFRDLAEGLASRGVAVLRFDKASYGIDFFPRKIDPMQLTVQDEYFDPLTDALALVAKTPELDGKRVFLLGHSMGGWLLPWMISLHPEVKGGIIASGNARHLADIGIQQDQYLYKLQAPGISDAELAMVKAMDVAKAKLAKDPNLDEHTPLGQLPYGAPAHSWRFMATYDAPAVAAKLTLPMLVLQGGRDYNVTVADDLPLWKQAFAGHKDVTMKLYPDLDHHYLTGSGTGTPQELLSHGHVAASVVDDVAAWVAAH
jgi:dienelactone hydrolase